VNLKGRGGKAITLLTAHRNTVLRLQEGKGTTPVKTQSIKGEVGVKDRGSRVREGVKRETQWFKLFRGGKRRKPCHGAEETWEGVLDCGQARRAGGKNGEGGNKNLVVRGGG